MINESSDLEKIPAEGIQTLNRRLFLRSIGKWSSAAILAAVGGAWLASSPEARAGVWINRRGPVRGGWINRPRGGWVNRRIGGGSSWVNRW